MVNKEKEDNFLFFSKDSTAVTTKISLLHSSASKFSRILQKASKNSWSPVRRNNIQIRHTSKEKREKFAVQIKGIRSGFEDITLISRSYIAELKQFVYILM